MTEPEKPCCDKDLDIDPEEVEEIEIDDSEIDDVELEDE